MYTYMYVCIHIHIIRFKEYLAQEHSQIDLDLDILSQIRMNVVRTVSAAWPQVCV